MDIYEEPVRLHKENKGKIGTFFKVKIKNRKDPSLAYTPGVAQPCREIAKDISMVYEYTIKQNTVAVVSDVALKSAEAVRQGIVRRIPLAIEP